MTPVLRWAVAAVVAAAVVATPVTVAVWPVADRDVSAADLLAHARASEGRGWSGYVETRGTLQLPSADRFDSVGAIFGEELRLRVWWRDDESWRVDRLFTAGETDLVRDGGRVTEWSYERSRVNVSRDPEIRLPRVSDLVPPELGARVLSDAEPAAVSRLPELRVAGRVALGLRVQPDARSSIEHADVWVDEETGVPLLVEVLAVGDSEPSFRSTFVSFDEEVPAPELVAFAAPPDAEQTFDDVLDVADAANQFAPFVPPATVAGLERRGASDGAVGVYGAGLTQLVAIPLRDQEAVPLREQLLRTAGNREAADGTVVAIGPLGVMLTGAEGQGGWLVAGTVTGPTLEDAAADILSGTSFAGDAP